MGFGQNLKRLRYEKGIGPEDLSTTTGLSKTAIRSIESGKTAAPSARTAKLLADALGVAVADLFEGTGFLFPIQADQPAEVVAALGRLKLVDQ